MIESQLDQNIAEQSPTPLSPLYDKNVIAYILHKPTNTVCSTVDPQLTDVVTKLSSPRRGEAFEREPRLTIYDVAKQSGFPSKYSLVGRLDCDTSGVIMFTIDTRLMR